MKKEFLTAGEAAKALGISISTIRLWDRKGILKPDERTAGGDRRYAISSLKRIKGDVRLAGDVRNTVAYARVSSRDQKDDLARQVAVLEAFCSSHGFTYEVIQDIGSGMNYYKKGLKRLLDDILEGKVGRLVITHKDRLLRFGAELVFSICEAKQVEVIIINKGDENVRFEEEEELAKDMLEIITVFSARLYGSRSNKNKKLLQDVRQAVSENLEEDK